MRDYEAQGYRAYGGNIGGYRGAMGPLAGYRALERDVSLGA